MTKVYAVLGLARAGIPAARFLAGRGARVLGFDNRTLDELGDEARALADLGVELHLGEHGYAGLDECSTIVLSPGLKVHHEPLRSVLAECEARGSEVIGELELAARHCPAPIVAVTGTKGKSTTVKLITEMLQACGRDAVRAGNTGIPLIAELPNLSPQGWAIVEVSSFQLEKAPTFRPRVAVLLNLLEDHQDYHPSLEQYWATKLKIFANQQEPDRAVLNGDDPRLQELVDNGGQFEGRQVLKVANAVSTARGDCGLVCRRGENLGFLFGNEFIPVVNVEDIPLRGEHNWSNVAAALAAVAGTFAGMEAVRQHVPDMAAAIRRFESLPHRLEIVGHAGGITWVNDSQATIPEAAMRALQAFKPPVTLIAGGRAKLEHEGAYDSMGRAIARDAHLLVTIGEAAGTLAEAARRGGMDEAKIIDAETLTNAVEQAKMRTPPGGTVVLSPACASFDQFKSYEERGSVFRAAVEALEK